MRPSRMTAPRSSAQYAMRTRGRPRKAEVRTTKRSSSTTTPESRALVHALNAQGRHDLVLVDDLKDGHKFVNLAGATFADYYDWREFLPQFDQLARAGEGIEDLLELDEADLVNPLHQRVTST